MFSKWGYWQEMERGGKCDQGIDFPGSFSVGSLGAALSLDLRSQLLGGSPLCPHIQGPLPLLARNPGPHWCSLFQGLNLGCGACPPLSVGTSRLPAPVFCIPLDFRVVSAQMWQTAPCCCGEMGQLVCANPKQELGQKPPASTLTLAF